MFTKVFSGDVLELAQCKGPKHKSGNHGSYRKEHPSSDKLNLEANYFCPLCVFNCKQFLKFGNLVAIVLKLMVLSCSFTTLCHHQLPIALYHCPTVPMSLLLYLLYSIFGYSFPNPSQGFVITQYLFLMEREYK